MLGQIPRQKLKLTVKICLESGVDTLTSYVRCVDELE